MRTQRRKVLLRVGLGLFAVAVLLQLVPYGRDHTNPPVTQDAPWPDGWARELATAAYAATTTLASHCLAIQGGDAATPHRLCVVWAMPPLDVLPRHPHPCATDRSSRTTTRTTAAGRPSWRVRSGTCWRSRLGRDASGGVNQPGQASLG